MFGWSRTTTPATRPTTVTDDEPGLREMLAKGSDATFLRKMVGCASQRLLELEEGEVIGAKHGKREVTRRRW